MSDWLVLKSIMKKLIIYIKATFIYSSNGYCFFGFREDTQKILYYKTLHRFTQTFFNKGKCSLYIVYFHTRNVIHYKIVTFSLINRPHCLGWRSNFQGYLICKYFELNYIKWKFYFFFPSLKPWRIENFSKCMETVA